MHNIWSLFCIIYDINCYFFNIPTWSLYKQLLWISFSGVYIVAFWSSLVDNIWPYWYFIHDINWFSTENLAMLLRLRSFLNSISGNRYLTISENVWIKDIAEYLAEEFESQGPIISFILNHELLNYFLTWNNCTY